MPAATGNPASPVAPSMLRALRRVLSPSGFPYASGYHLFKDAYFGRDSLEVAEDLLDAYPHIARTVIRRLATLQGTGADRQTEEEPGKIHHEYRALTLDGKPIDEGSRAIFRHLAEYWEIATTPDALNALTELVNYSTVDATPLYVRLIARYCRRVGTDVLDERYRPRGWTESGALPTIRESVRRAIQWITRAVERSEPGLLEFQRMTAHGHRFQAWKDGTTSYLHADGSFANYTAPIASIEVQGLAYDALTAADGLLDDVSPEERARWVQLAERLQQAVFERFWMPDERYFAMALDRDPLTGKARQVRTITSNPGALLDSAIFDALPAEERKIAVAAIVERIYSDEFLTPVGVRCSSLCHRDLQDYMAYQSSHTVWHKETYDIARGLRRQGFPLLATDLEVRILNAINLVGGATEFLYVLPDSRVDYNPFSVRTQNAEEPIFGTNVPENDQAWSISAALAIKWRWGHPAPALHGGGWQSALERRKTREIAQARLLQTREEIERAPENMPAFRLDSNEGWRRERAFVRTHELSPPDS